jgi:hypothetical protein
MSRKEQEAEVKRTTAGASGTAPAKERDFGDSAGYGGGGSSQDFQDVVGEDPEPKKPNSPDVVMTTPEKSGS